jgi:hypothetical protein
MAFEKGMMRGSRGEEGKSRVEKDAYEERHK